MHEHERYVVPVFGHTTRKGGRGLGKQESGKAGDVDLGSVGDVTVSDTQFANFDVERRETSAAKVHGPKILACVERDSRLCRLIVQVGQQLELDDRSASDPD